VNVREPPKSDGCITATSYRHLFFQSDYDVHHVQQINISISSGSFGGNKFTCHVFVTPVFVKNVLPLSSSFN